MIQFDVYSCVRVYYRYAQCSKCVDVCPTKAVYIEDDKVRLLEENCVRCAACVGNCPTGSFKIDGLDPQKVILNLGKMEDGLVSCKSNVPCLSFLSSEYLVTLALEKKSDIVMDIGFCKECIIKNQLDVIKKNMDMANYILESIPVNYRVLAEDVKFEKEQKKESSRRDIFKLFAKKTAALAFWAMEDKIQIVESEEENGKEYKNIVSEKVVPNGRFDLIDKLSSLDIKDDAWMDVSRIDFSSDKWIDNKLCSNCGICSNVCPTGALASSDDRLKILFNPSLCIKCKICHDVCPEKCLYLEDKLYIKDFVSNRYGILSTHVMIPCSECLVPFSYKGDSTVCPRCRKLEDEVRDLLKIGD